MRLYDHAIELRARAPGSWPQEIELLDLLDELEDARLEWGLEPEPFARTDYNVAYQFVLSSGDYGGARAVYERAVATYPDGTGHLALLWWALAEIHRMAGRWNEALDCLDQSDRQRVLRPEALDARRALVMASLERANIYLQMGLFEDAVPLVEAAVDESFALEETWIEAPSGDQTPLWPDALSTQMSLAIALDDEELLREAFGRAQDQLLMIEDRRAEGLPAIRPAHSARFALRLALGRAELERVDPRRPKGALTDLRALLESTAGDGSALLAIDRLIGEQWLSDLEIEAGELERAEARLAAIEGSVAAHEQGLALGPPGALQIRQRELQARLALARGGAAESFEAPLARALEGFEAWIERWGATPLDDRGQASLHTRQRMQATETVIELLLAAHGEQRGAELGLERIAEAQAAGTLARALGAEAPGLDEVRTLLLPPEGGLIVYVPGAMHSRALVLDADGVGVFEVAAIYQLDPLRRTLLGLVERWVREPHSREMLASRLEEARSRMAAALLPPDLRARIERWQDLVVVGLDGLGFVPFELLPFGDEGALGELKAVSYLPSLPVGVELVRRLGAQPERAPGPMRLLVVAAPDAPASGEPTRDPLSFGARERRQLLGEELIEARVEDGAAASLDLFRADDLLAGFDALQLIAHGVPAARVDRPFALRLHPTADGEALLDPAAAERLEVPPMVLLSACSAWQGILRRGDDGRGHLGGAFLLAGAGTVLLSSTAVEYHDTLALTGRFLEGVGEQALTPARSLLGARRSFLAEAPPEEWLSAHLVHLLGVASGPTSFPPAAAPAPPTASSVLPPRPSRWPYAGALLLAGGLVAWAVMRRRAARAADPDDPPRG